jgi:23S rRNA (guanosine2251-2'-O)-methyltransferase
MEKNIKYLGLELSLKLSSRNYSRQSLYSKEMSSELMKDLMKVMKRGNINFSYVQWKKLNRLTPNNHQGAVASISPISF